MGSAKVVERGQTGRPPGLPGYVFTREEIAEKLAWDMTEPAADGTVKLTLEVEAQWIQNPQNPNNMILCLINNRVDRPVTLNADQKKQLGLPVDHAGRYTAPRYFDAPLGMIAMGKDEDGNPIRYNLQAGLSVTAWLVDRDDETVVAGKAQHEAEVAAAEADGGTAKPAEEAPAEEVEEEKPDNKED